MYEKPDLSDEQLRDCLQEQYDLVTATLDFLPLGLDSKAGVYRVVDGRGTPYLLKARSGLLYGPGCLVPRYLFDQGIASVVAPIPTKGRDLWIPLENWTVVLYPFIDGDTSWTGMTNEHWKQVGSTFRQIHQALLPSPGFESLRREAFDLTEYAHWVRVFGTRHADSEGGDVYERALRASWMAHQPTIEHAMAALEKLAVVLREQSGPHVICHADLHPANLLRDQGGHVFVIDWDEVMLAPKERDFLFVQDATADGLARQETSPFFQGYGPAEIDWVALTYYRYERMIQDLIVCGQEVCFRDDLGDETRAASVQLFRDVLAPGGEVDAAHATAAHLPADLAL